MCLWCHLWWDGIWQMQLDRNDVLPSSYLAAFSSHSQISLMPALGFWSLTPWTCNGCERAELSETPHTAYTLYRVRLPSWSLRRWRRYSYTRNRNSLAVTGKIMLTAQDSLPQETGWDVCLRFLILAHSPQLSSYLFPLAHSFGDFPWMTGDLVMLWIKTPASYFGGFTPKWDKMAGIHGSSPNIWWLFGDS